MSRLPVAVGCLFALLSLASSVPVASRNQKATPYDSADGRVPRYVTPRHYNMELTPDIYTGGPPFKFEGYVEIFVTALEVTNSVILHARNLNVTGLDIRVGDGTPVPSPSPIVLSYNYSAASEFLQIDIANSLVIGAYYYIRVLYTAPLGNSGNGLYYDSYVDTDGSTKYMAATQMESIEARAAFPCFDEPDMKATFNITLVVKPPMVALSNMNEIATDDRGNGWVAHMYDTSPVMSTYQVCACIGDFIYEEANWQGITSYPVRIYARPQMSGKLAFAASVAAKLQAWLEQETGVAYTLPKQDHIALPGKGGAMENWGLITYGEDYLCVDPETSGGPGKLSVVSVIAHELAHDWYGNLVTCDWWTDIWLNEGFATHYNYYPQETLGWPASETQQGDGRRGTQQFFDIDQRNTSDPVRKIINTTSQADDSFGGSTYPKGGALLRMMRTVLTPATFKKGLTRYLNKFQYGTAVTDDLWTELTAQAADDGVKNPDGTALDVKFLMDAWLNQMGYPVLTVTRNGDGTATVTSKRFFNPRGQTANTYSEYNYSWNVPITVATRSTSNWEITPSGYIKFGETSTTLYGVPTSAGEWIMINPRQMFFYRVDYDNILRADLVNQLIQDSTKIPSESRSQFIDDSFALSRTLSIAETLAMETTRYLATEFTANPWTVTFKHLRYGDRILRHYLWHGTFRSYVLSLLVPVYNQSAWVVDNTESPLYATWRRDVLLNTCFFGDAGCRTQAKSMFNAYKANPDVNSIPSDQLPTILCTGVAEGIAEDWSLVFDQYQKRRTSPIREERYAYLFGLACSSDTVWLDRLLNYIVRGELIDARDQNTALTYLIQNNVGLPIVWGYLDNSWPTVPSGINKLTALRNIIQTVYDVPGQETYFQFMGKYPPTSDWEKEMFMQYGLIIQQNIDWITANEQTLADWLVSHAPTTGRASVAQLAAPLPMTAVDPMDVSLIGGDYLY